MVTPPAPPGRTGVDGKRSNAGDDLLRDDRSQALTLESITAAILMLAAIGFALQMTAVTPLSASTSSQHLENQLQSTGDGVLASSAETGALEDAVLYWDIGESEFHGAGERSYYRSGAPDTPFGNELTRTFGDRNIAYNVVVHYHTADGEMSSQRMIEQGEPSDHAVSASRTVALTDDHELVDKDGKPTGQTLGEVEDFFYAPDAGIESGGNRPLYNLVRVEVIAWRI